MFCWCGLLCVTNELMIFVLVVNFLQFVSKVCFYLVCRKTATPIFDLLENRYQEKWLKERREAELKHRLATDAQVMFCHICLYAQILQHLLCILVSEFLESVCNASNKYDL